VGELNYIGHFHLGIIKFLKNVMGFSFSSKKEKQAPSPVSQDNTIVTQNSGVELTKPEIEALLSLIKSSTFKGDQVEHIYNLVFKLQEHYSTLSD
jgi:hypothetical protein